MKEVSSGDGIEELHRARDAWQVAVTATFGIQTLGEEKLAVHDMLQ